MNTVDHSLRDRIVRVVSTALEQHQAARAGWEGGSAAFGAIVSDKSKKGAKRGAAIGAVVGGASSAHRQEEVYKRVYDECMRSS